jgi:hypothetical protein
MSADERLAPTLLSLELQVARGRTEDVPVAVELRGGGPVRFRQ